MTAQQYVVLAMGFFGLCSVGLLTHGAVTIPSSDREALTGVRAMVHAELEQMESVVPAGLPHDDRRWSGYLHILDDQLAAGHIDGAVRTWHDAYGAALEARTWESMIAVGDAFMKIGRAAGTPGGARMNARVAYVSALIRARRERSVDGALLSAKAFQDLGDRALVEQCLHIAGQLASHDDLAQQKVREARRRWEMSQNQTEF
jgi:hypothetical protein